MPSSSSRSRTATRRSPRPAPREALVPGPHLPRERPMVVPFAAVFGLLVAAEEIYLLFLLGAPSSGWSWYLLVPVLLAAAAVAGAVLVFLGRARAWLLLAVASVLPLLGMLALVLLFGALGGGSATWGALLLLIGPLVAFALSVRRPVRAWTRPARARRPPGGRRPVGGSR